MKDTIYTYRNKESFITIQHNVVDGFYTMERYHFHNYSEIYFLVSGERYYFIKDKVYHVCAGDLVFISPHEIHKTIDTEVSGHERILILLEENFVGTFNNSVQFLFEYFKYRGGFVLRPGRENRQYIQQLLEDMIRESQGNGIENEVVLQSLAMQLLVFIYRNTDDIARNFAVSDSPIHQKVSKVVKYINSHYMEKLTIEDISRLFYISPYYFCRIFKDATGFTFVEYLNTIRIREAQILLLKGELNITKIADRVGFGSITHFNRTFKKVLGDSPLHYQKKIKP